jgi:hypothetical protein
LMLAHEVEASCDVDPSPPNDTPVPDMSHHNCTAEVDVPIQYKPDWEPITHTQTHTHTHTHTRFTLRHTYIREHNKTNSAGNGTISNSADCFAVDSWVCLRSERLQMHMEFANQRQGTLNSSSLFTTRPIKTTVIPINKQNDTRHAIK